MSNLILGSVSTADAKRVVTVTALWQKFGLPGEPSKKCRSPFREDRKPSFEVSVDPADGFEKWKDWSTGEHGDVIDFVAKARGITNSEAIAEVIALAGGATGKVNFYTGPSFRSKAEIKRRMRIHPENFHVGTPAELAALSRLRCISIEGLRLASEQGVLRFGNCLGHPSWTVLDHTYQLAQSRRMDGEKFPAAGELSERKSHSWHGSEQSWPLNVESLKQFDKAALVEGAPDLLSAFGYAFAERKEKGVAIIAMLGAGCEIPADVLPLFKGKQVRIFSHADDAGKEAAERWWEQLESVGADLSWFDFEGLTQENGEPVRDFNDLCRLSYEDFERERELWEGVLP